jgi:small subunit ribosomal protein S17
MVKDKKQNVRDIGIDVMPPTETCSDRNCPFHGELPVRGQLLTGIVVSNKMQGSVIVKREYLHYIPKYERYEKRTSKYSAHCPPCIKLNVGDKVRIAECRPLSKTVSFVVVEKLQEKK